MPGRLVSSILVVTLLLLTAGSRLSAAPRAVGPLAQQFRFVGLRPGEFVVHRQRVPIEIVLIGFADGQVDTSTFPFRLPSTYTPAVRYPQFYGLQGRDLGLEFTFDYTVTRRNRRFEDQFFRHLAKIGTPGPPTVFQEAYNQQTRNLVDVTGPVLHINAVAVEKYLADKAQPRANGYTVYFINWYNRPDFQFHVYTKTDEPDPDTRFNFGRLAESAVNSWGGSRSRSWFYDFSAGPEFNTTNWLVDRPDIDGDGNEEYRMPVIWEYADAGYRTPDRLGPDMALLTRYVAINLLFTTSPLYDPLLTVPDTLGRRVVNVTMFEDDPASRGAGFINLVKARQAWQRFQPHYPWRTQMRVVDPIDARAKQALDIFTGNLSASSCWERLGSPFGELFCFAEDHRADYVPRYPADDYVTNVFAFNSTEEGLGSQAGLLGMAEDNWVDGTPSHVFVFSAGFYRERGYGFTATTIHEVGHHIGLSHPHDGYDAEGGFDYGPDSDHYFAWSGDESHTVMHYLSLTNEFGVHNRDNMYRWETAGYLNWSNALAADILASPDAPKVYFALLAADIGAALARYQFDRWDYASAVASARATYLLLQEAADAIGASSAKLAAARRRLPDALIRRYVCRPRQLVEQLQGRP